MKNKLLLTIASCIALCYQGLGAASDDVSAIVEANPSAWKAMTATLADPEVFSAIMLAKTAATIAIGGAVLWYGDRVRDNAASALQFRRWNKILAQFKKDPRGFVEYAREHELLTDQTLKELADFKNNMVKHIPSVMPERPSSHEVGMHALVQRLKYQVVTSQIEPYMAGADSFFAMLAIELLPIPSSLIARKIIGAAQWLINKIKFSSLMAAFFNIQHSLVATIGGMGQAIDNLECILLQLKACEGTDQCLKNIQEKVREVCAMGSATDVEEYSQDALRQMIVVLVEQKKALEKVIKKLKTQGQRGDALLIDRQMSIMRDKARDQLDHVQAVLRELISMSEKSI